MRTVAAFALIILAACGSVPVSEISGSVVLATTITDTTAVTVPNVVPWVDRPAPPYMPPEEPVVSFLTDARPCQSADLDVSDGQWGAGMGNQVARFMFTNRSTSPCVLNGYPTIAGVSANGDVTALTATQGTYFGDPGPPSNIAPGAVAALNIATAGPCKTDPAQSILFPTLRLGLPGGDTVDVSGEGIDIYCGLWISLFGVPALMPPPPPTIEPTLKVSVAMPESVPPGEELVYTVTITNTSGTAYPLDPCPSYTQAVGSTIVDYYLNCDAFSVIDAGQSVTFEMRIAVVADLSQGEATKFGWFLHVPGDPGAGGAVNINA